MAGHFGIDSSAPFGNVYPTVVQRIGKPAWCARYLYQIQGVSSGVTREEIAAIHAEGMALLLIANDTSAASVAGDYVAGQGTGQLAVGTARALGAPAGIAISVDWETNMSPTGAWAHGYMDALTTAGYHANMYLNPGTPAHAAAYQVARAAGGYATYWSSEPEWNDWFDKVRTDFTPWTIAGHEGEVLFHQYSENNLGGIVDLNVCTDAGLALLWGTTPPPPPPPKVSTYRTNATVGLKSKPDHTSPVAIDPHGKPVTLEKGAEVVMSGSPQGEWQAVKLPASPVHGYILVVNIVEDAV